MSVRGSTRGSTRGSKRNNKRKPLTLDESINEAFNTFEKYYDNNDLDAAIAQCELYANANIYFSCLRFNLLTVKALLTYDENDMDSALKACLQATALCNVFRRRGLWGELLKLIRRPNYDNYSEIEVHSELIYAASLGYHSMLSLMRAQTFREMVSIFNKLRLSKKSYKECRLIFKHRTQWESETSKVNFEAAICLERGFRHLLISYFPPKLMSFVKFLGYRGVRDIAYTELTKTAYKLCGMQSRIAEVVLLSYNLFFEPLGSCGRRRLDVCDAILNKRVKTHPNCVAFKLFKAKFSQLNGEFETAIEEFEQVLSLGEGKMYHKIAHWELMWSHALSCQFDQSLKYAELLRTETQHSPVITTYCEGAFKYYLAYTTNDAKLKDEATEIIKILPTFTPKYIGKVITFEKECLESANDYLNNDNYLFLPVMSMLYEGNFFYLIDGNVPLLERHLQIVEDEMQVYLKRNDKANSLDYYLDSLFYKGCLMKHMRRLIEAQHCFNTILFDMDNVSKTRSLIPQTLMELGLIQAMLTNKDGAKKFFEKALKHYSGYRSESLVQIRIHSAIIDLDYNIQVEHNNNNLDIIEEYARRLSELTKI